MKPEDIIKLIKEDSIQLLEGLTAIESMSKELSSAAQSLGNVANEAKKIISIAEKVSKRWEK